jgi:pimeloyl-ACP methyl ester carboxylesterase
MNVLLSAFVIFMPPAAAGNVETGPCLTPDKSCTERLQLKEGWVLVYRNWSLKEGNRDVEEAVVMVHGAQRNGDGYYGTAMASAASRGHLMKALIVAPQFKGSDGPACHDSVEEGELFFGCQAWNAGYPAINSPLMRVNSFDAMDRIVQLISDRTRFPRLRSIVLVGHSGGGQFMQRYAASNQIEPKIRLPIRYVVANPSSYVYLSDVRLRSDGSCTPDGKCTGPFGPYWDRTSCTGYNRYRYGLEALSGYAAQTGQHAIRRQFSSRDVTYLIGDLDQLQDSDLDKGCAAQAQGANRRERGINFWNYMRLQYQAEHKLVMVPRCGHNAACMFGSAAGARVLFP